MCLGLSCTHTVALYATCLELSCTHTVALYATCLGLSCTHNVALYTTRVLASHLLVEDQGTFTTLVYPELCVKNGVLQYRQSYCEFSLDLTSRPGRK